MKSIGLLYRTLTNYKISQLIYRLYYKVIKKKEIESQAFTNSSKKINSKSISLTNKLFFNQPKYRISNDKVTFTILNTNLEGNLKTIWSKKEIPDLINFNLNYLGFLSSPLPLEKKKLLFESHIESSKKGINKFSYEPFVVSVKLIECIRFLTLHSIKKLKYDTFLFSQAKFLLKRLEKDLLGNHYLFNGLGLLYAAYYFNDKIFLSTAEKIIIEQLSIQFLNDGMHYELSPMYQVIIINELLKCYDLLLRNNQDNEDTKMLIKDKLEHAMGFYNFISIDGFYPNLNDSYFSYELKNDLINSKYHILGLKPKSVLQGKDSGLRKYTSGLMTLIFDSGQIGPNHQPGHAHADSLTFCLYYDSSPMIVDTGTSVYENTERRYLERSTESHNTIKYKNLNSSEVWSSFRVGRIAKTFIEKEGENFISSYHNGYKFLGLIHYRSINVKNGFFQINDTLNKNVEVTSYLHFHPKVKVEVDKDRLILNDSILIDLDNFMEFKLEPYMYAEEFNKLEKGMKFVGKLYKYSRFVIKQI